MVSTSRPIVPTTGWINFRKAPRGAIGRYPVNLKRKIKLSQRRIDRLNSYQKLANSYGFVVALVCPICGEVIKTKRTGDLEEGVAAECPKCGKQWLDESNI